MEFELEFIRNSKQIQGVVENIRSAEVVPELTTSPLIYRKTISYSMDLTSVAARAMPILNTTLWIQLGFATTGI